MSDRITALLVVLLGFTGSVIHAADPASPAFELRQDERVIFLGNTFVEREQRDGYIETALTCAFPSRKVIFRNMGWSGDTVRGEARAYFGSVEDGYKHLISHVQEFKPTLIFVGYGSNAAFEGAAGVESFQKAFDRLLNDLKATGARLVLLSPMPHFHVNSPLSEEVLRQRNAEIDRYAGLVHQAAERHGARYVDVLGLVRGQIEGKTPWTINGMHFNAQGYAAVAEQMLVALGLPADPSFQTRQKLRQTIVEKNELFFHRYRPQNETYLRGFRKHEQGQNAKEIAQFDPLIAKHEEKIHELAQSKGASQ